jgi:hypothetical protein
MSTPLIILASILAFFALVLIPLMMLKSGPQRKQDQQHAYGKQGKKSHKKKKKR